MKTTILLIAILITASLSGYSQTISTFEDGTPDDAIILDNNGNIYCSNYMGDTVFKFTPSGEVSSFITGLNTPNGLAFNSNQELYVCDGQGNTIYKYDINGALLESYPVSGHPSGIVKNFDDESMIFTLYTGNKIYRLDPDGTITLLSEAEELDGPVGIVFDELGSLYIGNYNDRKIYRLLGDGTLEYVAEVPTDGGAYPNLGFITYGQGKLWGTSMGSDKIYTVNLNAIDDVTLFAGSTQGTADGDISEATFHTPNGIYFDSNEDKLYVTDFGAKNLRIISGIVLGNDDYGKKNPFVIAPNPVQDGFIIQSENGLFDAINIDIYNTVGASVFKKSDYFSGEVISTVGWSQGVYLLQIKTNHETFIQRILK